jgi:hypothetical protein
MAAAGQMMRRPQDRDVEVGMRDIVCLFVSIRGGDDRIDDGRPDMPQYLLSIYQPDGDSPPPEVLEPIMRDIDAVDRELRAAGAWVFTGGLHAPDTATVLRASGGDVLVTDGPFAEGKEHVGGFWIIQAVDLDEALAWARKATVACTLPVEVRPMVDMAES